MIIGETFTRNRSMADGYQIYCRECDETHKAQDPNYGWAAFQRALAARGESLRGWTRESYLKIVCEPGKPTLGSCSYCGNALARWGKGHHIDRIDSFRHHTPDNCVSCCSGCNRAKGSKSPEAWRHVLTNVLANYPKGKVPWQTIDPKGPAPNNIPDLSPYALELQPLLFPTGDIE